MTDRPARIKSPGGAFFSALISRWHQPPANQGPPLRGYMAASLRSAE